MLFGQRCVEQNETLGPRLDALEYADLAAEEIRLRLEKRAQLSAINELSEEEWTIGDNLSTFDLVTKEARSILQISGDRHQPYQHR